MKPRKIVLFAAAMLACGLFVQPATADAKEITVKMVTRAPDGKMLVFDPMFVKADVGDTVVFEPMDKAGHTSVSVLVPNGVASWTGQPNQKVTVKLTQEGIYLVKCKLHENVGMVGVVQAGKPVNLAAAKAAAKKEEATMLMHKDRFDKLLAMVK